MSRIRPRSMPSPVRSQPRAEGLGLAAAPRVLRRSLAWILVPTLLVAAGSTVFVNVVSPRYTGEAKVMLESRDAAFTRTSQDRPDPTVPIGEQAVASQVQVMASRDLAREAIRRLKLVGNPEFDPAAGGFGPVQRALMMLGIGQNPLDRPAEDRVLEAFSERLLVYPAGNARTLVVAFRANDAKLAAEGANTVAQLYISTIEADTGRYASSSLGGNVEALRKRVAEAEAKVEAYRAKHGLVGMPGQPLNAQQLGELSSQLSQARILKADLAGRVKAIKDMIKDGRAFEIPDVANNEVIRRTVENRISVRAMLAMESRTLLPAHPRIKELRAQLEDLDAQIKASAERVVRTLENDASIAGSRVESLQAAVNGQQDVVLKGNSSEIQLRALEREAKAQRDQLESYMTRYREASARDAESATPADARIVSRAVVPEIPSFPKKLPIVGFATLVTLMLTVCGALAAALLADGGPARRSSGSDERGERLEPALEHDRFAFPEAMPPAHWDEPEPAPAAEPAVAAVLTPAPARDPAPAGAAASARVSSPSPVADPAPAATFDLDPLIARLSAPEGASHGLAGRRVLVMETRADDSGEPVPEALARALGRGASVVTVDLNGPAGDADEPGITDLVAGEAAFLDVIQAERASGLHRIGSGQVEIAVLVTEAEALALTLEAMAEAYDWIVCRLRPDAEATDLLAVVAAQMDSVVIVSNADAEDPALADLYAIADEAGAGQILVARDSQAEPVAVPAAVTAGLRLNAA